jgi:hemoglobin-like flavoprotein
MTIQDSLSRVLEHRDGVADLFYQMFFDRHPEARPYFTGVNLKYQVVLLTMALMVVERHHENAYLATELYLKYLGHKHHLRNVPADLYPKWVESLLAALEKFHGADWDASVAGEWRAALDGATEVMIAGYREPVHI